MKLCTWRREVLPRGKCVWVTQFLRKSNSKTLKTLNTLCLTKKASNTWDKSTPVTIDVGDKGTRVAIDGWQLIRQLPAYRIVLTYLGCYFVFDMMMTILLNTLFTISYKISCTSLHVQINIDKEQFRNGFKFCYSCRCQSEMWTNSSTRH